MTTTTPSPTPAADRLAKARADLAKATMAAKLATAKRARLAAEVRALEAEAEIEAMRIQARADRERADVAEARAQAAEDALERERAAHLEEERAHAAEVDHLKRPAVAKRKNGATPATTRDAVLTAMAGTAELARAETLESSGLDPTADRQTVPKDGQQASEPVTARR